MIKFYFSGAPNPTKVALFMEEAGVAYEAIPIDTRKGQQHEPEFLKINPNAKVPVIIDGEARVFNSNAILLYLAEKTGKFLPPAGDKNRGEMLSWLMFVATGVGPFAGQSVHFTHMAPEKIGYAITRYNYEAMRHFKLLDEHLTGRKYMVADTYTIIDMDVWGWARMAPFVMNDKEVWAKLPNLKSLVDEVEARPAAKKALALKDRFTWKTDLDDEARRNMFRHIAAKA